MNKIILILMGMFLIGLVSATVYSTPGFINESNEISSEVSLTTNLDENLEDGLKNRFKPIVIVFIVVITLAAIYVQIRFLLKRRRTKKRKVLVPILVKDALKNMEKAKDISKTLEEFDGLVKELGLEEVIGKKEEKPKEEGK